MQHLFYSRAGVYGFADVPEGVVKGFNDADIFHGKPPQGSGRSFVAEIGQALPGLCNKKPCFREEETGFSENKSHG
jgi:hypothetical protein